MRPNNGGMHARPRHWRRSERASPVAEGKRMYTCIQSSTGKETKRFRKRRHHVDLDAFEAFHGSAIGPGKHPTISASVAESEIPRRALRARRRRVIDYACTVFAWRQAGRPADRRRAAKRDGIEASELRPFVHCADVQQQLWLPRDFPLTSKTVPNFYLSPHQTLQLACMHAEVMSLPVAMAVNTYIA